MVINSNKGLCIKLKEWINEHEIFKTILFLANPFFIFFTNIFLFNLSSQTFLITKYTIQWNTVEIKYD